MAEGVFYATGVLINEELQLRLRDLDLNVRIRPSQGPSDPPLVFYDLLSEYPSPRLEQLERYLERLGVELGFRYFFRFEDDEYEAAPYYRMGAFGNTPQGYMASDGSAYITHTFCSACGIKQREQIAPLVINSSRLKHRAAVWVDGHRIVISERFAEKLAQWQVTGYELAPVVHRGKGSGVPAYQLIPTSRLPAGGSTMRFLYPPHLQDRLCPLCDWRRKMIMPLHYEKVALENAQDINMTTDIVAAADDTAHAIVISARLRRLILESGLALNARYDQEAKTDGRHWFFEPIVLV